MKFPSSVLMSLFLFVAETVLAVYLSIAYSSAGDRTWQSLTLLFCLLPCLLVQICLVFIHRDINRDRPLVLLCHLLQLGPLVRCLDAFYLYLSHGKSEEPYVNIIKKKQLSNDGGCVEVEKEVGRCEGRLFIHRSAFSRASVIQAFLGSAPQLTLQLYISLLQQHISLPRGLLMGISLLSIIYGALRCNVLAIKIKYDDYYINFRPTAYLCIFLWRFFEIATRVIVLVLFSSVFQIWTLPVVLINFLFFFTCPWILFCKSRSPSPRNTDKTLKKMGTAVQLCLLTFLYSGINMFCWSAIQLELSDPDLINKSQNWYRMAVYYMLRLIENAFLLLLWYIFQTDDYFFICPPVLVLQLLVSYGISVVFMLTFYQFCHPCRILFTSSISDGLLACFKFLCYMCIPSRASTQGNRFGAKLSNSSEIAEP
ncbi:endoplasmic reticulum membrane adapter protein XK [Spea bombifrons]|uniref:endoplasmic reticulum membrane adapter protein XK n=1 Tax=Spea bombifrons TaxID=233779 RepID=UPI00234B0875|nr:endoplasmic reticulum membrane adapter protein XK [Spea bombifrons]